MHYDFNNDIIKDLQDIIENLPNEQELNLAALRANTTEMKQKNKFIKIVDTSEGSWAVVQEYQKQPFGSDSEDCKKIRQVKATARKKNYNVKSKTATFKPSFTLQ